MKQKTFGRKKVETKVIKKKKSINWPQIIDVCIFCVDSQLICCHTVHNIIGVNVVCMQWILRFIFFCFIISSDLRTARVSARLRRQNFLRNWFIFRTDRRNKFINIMWGKKDLFVCCVVVVAAVFVVNIRIQCADSFNLALKKHRHQAYTHTSRKYDLASITKTEICQLNFQVCNSMYYFY